ncbi:MAG TPA: TonB-dependent receptor [Bacteroidota bacterium]|nr:TonB-dependent receptor [Bacteroidota bacterium]
MIRRLLPPAVLLLTYLLLPTSLTAGTTGKIAGHVRDSQTHEALAGVNIIVEGTSLGAAADPDGYYAILNIPPGEHAIIASAIGYVKKKIEGVKVSTDLTTTIDIELSSTVLEVSKEIVVTAERAAIQKDLTSSEAHVDATQIKTLPVTEVTDVLTLQSGITTDKSGGIHIRGGRSNEVAYWVDGISVSDAYDGSQSVQVDNNAIQELQVISGTFNAEYGQAMSGIVNIVTKDGDQTFHGNLQAYTGGHLSSDGYLMNNRPIYLNEQAYQSLSRSSNEIFYNLGTFRPFDTYDVEGSLSGPIPGIDRLTFYASARYYRTNGYLYGDRIFNPDGTPIHPITTIIDPVTKQVAGYQFVDDPTPMNDRTRYSGQAKLTYALSSRIRLSLSGLFSNIDYRDYNHDYFFVPDGDVGKHDRGYEGSAILTHTLSANAFYTLNLAYFLKTYREYYYDNPLDSGYTLPLEQSLNGLYAKGLYEFNHLGLNTHQFKRSTESRVAKFDITDQVNQLHQVKAGFELKLHRLYLEDYNVAPGTNSLGQTVPIIPPDTSALYQEYTRKPIEFSAYVQDKLEYEHMIVNVGLRFDYFNPNAQVLSDPLDPNVWLPQEPQHVADSSLASRMSYWYRNATGKGMISPRFGISYPITDKGILHFSYGHFLKIPSFQELYQNPGYKVTTISGTQGPYGNADLNPEKTIQYEFGLQQELTEAIKFDVTGFYRDTRDWVQTGVAIPVRDPQTATTFYTTYVNRDYGNIRGITLSIDKRPSDIFSFNFAYTFQVAEGTNSNPDDEEAAQVNNAEPAKVLVPLDWDQTHTANLTLGLGRQNWGLFLISRYGSGLPYTPVINQSDLRGQDVARGVTRNSRRQPDTYSVDLRAFKNIPLGGLNVNFFVKVYNLLDRRNVTNVYGQTGDATATLAALGAGSITGAGRLNPVSAYIIRPDFYSEPREIQIGAELNF